MFHFSENEFIMLKSVIQPITARCQTFTVAKTTTVSALPRPEEGAHLETFYTDIHSVFYSK